MKLIFREEINLCVDFIKLPCYSRWRFCYERDFESYDLVEAEYKTLVVLLRYFKPGSS